jgi:glycosyltransferase involved in cell wall biosynthesis
MTAAPDSKAYTVYADGRWPAGTGIGVVMSEMISASPEHVNIDQLMISGSAASPLSPVMIASALAKVRANSGVFWNPGFVPPLHARIPTVVTVHDLSHLEFYSRWHKLYYNVVFRNLYQKCDAIICVSDYTRTKFIKWSGMPSAKVHLVLNGGASPAFFENKETLELPFPYVLYPGNHRAYKNLGRLVTAYFASSLPKQGIHLVMTGSDNVALRDLARRFGGENLIHCLGALSSESVPKLYRGSVAVVFVSLSEGFGLPILEGMASSVPVLTSNITSMPEVAGDAAVLVDPYSTEDIKSGLDRIVNDSDLRAELVGKGVERATRFNWKRSAAEFWDVVDQLARR